MPYRPPYKCQRRRCGLTTEYAQSLNPESCNQVFIMDIQWSWHSQPLQQISNYNSTIKWVPYRPPCRDQRRRCGLTTENAQSPRPDGPRILLSSLHLWYSVFLVWTNSGHFHSKSIYYSVPYRPPYKCQRRRCGLSSNYNYLNTAGRQQRWGLWKMHWCHSGSL